MRTLNKILTIISMIFVVSVSNIYSKTVRNVQSENIYQLSLSVKSDLDFEEEYYMEVIPHEYARAFIYYTRNYPQIRKTFYSIMVHESCNFTRFRNKNKNGSIDMGPSQLNSENLKNKRFLEYYRPTDESRITSRYCYYMVMTIKLYWDLYNKYGEEYALYAYNGGDKAARAIRDNIKDSRYRSLIKNVKSYDKAVRSIMEEKSLEIQEYVSEARNKHMAILYKEYRKLDRLRNVSINKDVRKPIDNIVAYYVRRKDLSELDSEELRVILNPIIRGFYKNLG